MSKLIPKNPHDEFFKAVFGKPENTAEFLRKFLPAEVTAVLNLNSLKPVKDSLVGKELKSYYSDLLFTIESQKGLGYVYILFEHKSYKDRLLPLQLLRYPNCRTNLSTKGAESGSDARSQACLGGGIAELC